MAGLLSRKDLLRFAISGNNLEKTPVAVIMTRMPNIHTSSCRLQELSLGSWNVLSQYEVDRKLTMLEKVDSKKIISKISIKHIMNAFIKQEMKCKPNKIKGDKMQNIKIFSLHSSVSETSKKIISAVAFNFQLLIYQMLTLSFYSQISFLFKF